VKAVNIYCTEHVYTNTIKQAKQKQSKVVKKTGEGRGLYTAILWMLYTTVKTMSIFLN